MKKTIALALMLPLMLALGTGVVHAEDKKTDAKKSEKKNDKKPHAAKSDQNVFQKAESDVGHWARKNKIWGTPRPGD